MPTTITSASIQARINLILNQGTGSPAWTLAVYTGGTDALNSASGLARLMNDEKDYLFRNVFAMFCNFTGTYTAQNFQQRYDAFTPTNDGTNGSTTVAGSKLWWPRRAYIAGLPLEFVSENTMSVEDPEYQLTPGAPTNWYRSGDEYLGVWKVPVANTTVTAYGLCVPADFPADGTGGTDAIDTSQVELLIDGVCLRAINKVQQDAQMQARLPIIDQRYRQGVAAQMLKLPAYLRSDVDSPYKVLAAGGK